MLGCVRLAFRLGMSPQRCMREHSSTDFIRAIKFMDDDANAFHREDYYLAQIAAEIKRSYVKTPSNVRLKDHILEFTKAKEGVTKMADSKMFWGALVGMSLGE